MTTDAPKEKKIRDYVVAIIVAIITGLLGLRAAGEGTRLTIAATQTAEAKLITTATINAYATTVHKNSIATQQAFALTQQSFNVTQVAFYTTSTAIANNIAPTLIPPTPTPQSPTTNLSNLPTFFNFYSLLFFAWFVIAISQSTPRQKLLSNTIALISEPIIFKHSKNKKIPFYPRKLFEQLAQTTKESYERLNDSSFFKNPKHLDAQSTSSDFSTFGKIVILAVFILLLWADAIAAANTLQIYGLLNPLPSWLSQYWLSLSSGSLVSTIIGAWTIANLKKKAGLKNPISKVVSYFLVTSGLCLAFVFSIARYAELGFIPNTTAIFAPQIELLIINLLIPVNISLAIAILFPLIFESISAINGLLSLAIKSILYALSISYLLIFSLLIIIYDLIYRLLMIYLDVALFFAFSPLNFLREKIFSRRNNET